MHLVSMIQYLWFPYQEDKVKLLPKLELVYTVSGYNKKSQYGFFRGKLYFWNLLEFFMMSVERWTRS